MQLKEKLKSWHWNMVETEENHVQWFKGRGANSKCSHWLLAYTEI